MLLLYLFMGLTVQALGQLIKTGSCPTLSPMANIDELKLLGTWYEWGRIENFYEADLICGNLTYMNGANGNMIEHVEETFHHTGARYTWDGEIVKADGEPPGVFKLQFPDYAEHKYATGAFVGADWNKWAILHACYMMDPLNLQYMWILSKTRELDDMSVLKIREVVEKNNVPWLLIARVDQQDCPIR